MPTGYTSVIKDGCSFELFIERCAKSFGACVDMRDKPLSEPIPDEFKPSNYHKEELAKLTKEKERLDGMSLQEAENEAKRELESSLEHYKKGIREGEELREKYNQMLNDVHLWQPPTLDHEGLKSFMLQQLHSSMDRDCMIEYYTKCIRDLKIVAAKDWLHSKKEQNLEYIGYHVTEDTKEVDRSAQKTRWVQELRASIMHFKKEE